MGTKGVIFRVCCNGAVPGKEVPWEKNESDRNHPGTSDGVCGEQPFFHFVGDLAAGCQAAVGFTGAGAGTDISIPEIEFKRIPAAAFPAAARRAAAVSGGFHDFSNRWFGAAVEEQYGKK